MPRYRSAGGLDDSSASDGDSGFLGINQREQPNQLKPGEIVLSQNGRIDGFWQPRRGITLKSGTLSSSALPLKVNFGLLDSPITISTASRSSNVVTINLASGHNLSAGFVGHITIGDPDVATDPLTGTDNVSPGSYEMTYVDADTLTFASTGADESFSVDGTYGIVASTIDDSATSEISGSCAFSDPTSSNAESAILATPTGAKKVLLSDFTVTDVPYPSGLSVSGSVDMIQSLDRVFLFPASGTRSWEYIPNGRLIEASDYTSASGIVEVTLKNHGFTAGDTVTTADITYATTNPNGTHTVSSVVDADNFQYVIATGGGDETYTANTGKATSSGFSLVPAGDFTQPQAFNIAGNVWGVTGNVVTFTVAGNTTIKAGDNITVDATDVTELQPLVGNTYPVTSATSTTITFNAPIGNFTYGTGTSTEYIEFSGRFSQGGGFFHSPAPAWGVYFQRRLWVPYNYTPGGTQVSPTYTDRDVRDQIAASDILDPETFDSISSQFRITAGIADHLVGLHPFYEDSLLVLNRNSLHMVVGTQGSLQDTVVRELTREIGCLARRSVVSQGNNVFFLSDSGVYNLSFVDEYNLRGVERPLSEKIQPYIDRINKSLATDSVGIYFNNRYYLALPLDSSRGADDAKGNNSVVIYNMLNGAWESIDTYGSGDFLVSNFIIAQSDKRNQLYIVNDQGGLHLADDSEEARDIYSLNITGSSSQTGINYKLTTRGYSLGSLDRKKFSAAQVQMKSSTDSSTDVSFRFSSEDPDTDEFAVTDVETILSAYPDGPGQLPANEPGNLRFRLGNPRGIYGTLTIQRKIVGSVALGRPKVTSIKLDGSETNRQTITQI
jgi:hypothetical protein